MFQNIPTHSRMGRRANLLDSFSVSQFGIWTGTLLCSWLLHGILVYLCCVDKACGEKTSPDVNEQWLWYVTVIHPEFLLLKVIYMWEEGILCFMFANSLVALTVVWLRVFVLVHLVIRKKKLTSLCTCVLLTS